MLTLIVYIPESHLEVVKQALFDAGAGRVGNYEHCCWQTKGLGQFKPMKGSQPFIGTRETLETLEEYRIELVCKDEQAAHVKQALLNSHPYETPAYHFLRCERV